MFFDFSITIPAGTLEASPKEERLKLTHGVIHTFRLYIPPGPRGEVNLVIAHEGSQLYPYNRGGSLNADNVYIAFDDYFELMDPPYELVAKGWSQTADYDHTLHIQIGIVESKFALVSLRMARGLEKFFKMVGIKV